MTLHKSRDHGQGYPFDVERHAIIFQCENGGLGVAKDCFYRACASMPGYDFKAVKEKAASLLSVIELEKDVKDAVNMSVSHSFNDLEERDEQDCHGGISYRD